MKKSTKKPTNKKFSDLTTVRKKRSVDEAIVMKLKDEMIEISALNYLADLRWEANMTQKDLAKKLGVDQSRISRIETGDITRAEVGSLAAYVEAMGGTLEIVFHLGKHSISLNSSKLRK
jgi:DNA-binding XRE family transcriptional regulator